MLYLIATPIGNLEDMTFRAVETIKNLDVLFCEDTRQTKRLLDRYGLRVALDSYREEAHARKAERMIELLQEGKNVGLVSDAGTPGVSDPGGRLVAAVVERLPNVNIIPIPGPSAVAAIVSVAGFGGNGFTFLGFPPNQKGRQSFIREALDEPRTVILYESPHRISKLLESIREISPDRNLVVGRELTKLHETIYRGTAAEIISAIKKTSDKGEFAIAIESARHGQRRLNTN
ncbi:MAG: 16S rRNA (cytidine(1402)-2'-O)-methyltransferase [Patescibacteria group bacterium]|nr:16S rRNA (cytidine(1402)-2'-O)-methyltransferase [Patescibacteria group bacterium]